MQHSHEVREELSPPAIALRALIPEVMRGYAELSRAAMTPGELNGATKELLAIVIAITRECDGCIVSHTRSAVRAGVTRQALASDSTMPIATSRCARRSPKPSGWPLR